MSNAAPSSPASAASAPSNLNKGFVISLLFASHFLTYLDRAVMATAIPFISAEFGLSSVAAGSVLSAFFFGYALMQIPAGILADRFGPARLLLTAVILWTIFTGMTGLVHSLAAMIVVRVLFGLSEGPAPAGVSKTIASVFPREQIGRTNGVVLSATLLGSAAAPAFVTTIVLHWGWRGAFLSLLAPGFLLALAVYRVLGRSPELAPAKHQAERKDIGGSGESAWKTVLGSSQMRWCLATTFIASCVNWGLQNWLPTYLLKARGFGIAEMGMFASVPYAAGALGYLLGGYAGDRLFVGRRNILVLLCFITSAASTYAAAVASNGGIAVAFMTVTFLMLSMGLSNLFSLPLLLVPVTAVGRSFGVINTGAQIAGFVSPLLIGAVLDASNQNFSLVLYLVVGLLVASGITASRIR
ncbi:MFS transporter [Sphingobium amiense]|uniref:MFS transporter n=1 Tax=Sphingobium amiense TaxID=135719 RepID=A0A494W225_9SPHN|nr:MFS transporter [Sphingobium amiense]BBD97218.1 MFS transporter [Sphingobium amiense]